MSHIPFWAIVAVWTQPASSIKEKFLMALRPTAEWGPSDDLAKEFYMSKASCSTSTKSEDDTSFKCLAETNTDAGLLEYL
ncbi:hypothetical protein X975_13975, partial [Stegodyphus mimosarum]